jgi:hypothetical protein
MKQFIGHIENKFVETMPEYSTQQLILLLTEVIGHGAST